MSQNHNKSSGSSISQQLQQQLPDHKPAHANQQSNRGNNYLRQNQRQHTSQSAHSSHQHTDRPSPVSPVNTGNSKITNHDAALAIASNLAQTRMMRLLKENSGKNSIEPLITKLKTDILPKLAKLIKAENPTSESPQDTAALLANNSDLLKYRDLLKPLWQRVIANLPESRRPFYSEWEQTELMVELLLLVNRLRNHFCHQSRLGDAFDLSKKGRFTAFIKILFEQAVARAQVDLYALKDAHICEENEQQHSLNQTFGVVFILNLLLTKSQAEQLIAQLEYFKTRNTKAHQATQTIDRRLKKLFCIYCQRDGYSETQLDPKSALTREIIGYLTLPPLDSKAGQDQLHRWEQTIKNDPNTSETPQFRRESKLRGYIHRALDELNICPEIKFWGYYQSRDTFTDDEGGIEYSEWQNETASTPLTSQIQLHRHRDLRHRAYDRNTAPTENRRFVYDMSDGNLRFELDNNSTPTVGVMRLRDWFNLVYTLITDPGQKTTLLNHITDWLTNYQQSLSSNDLTNLPEEFKAHYPAQLTQSGNLKQRIKKRLLARQSRNQTLLGKLDKNLPPKQRLPINEQVHEIIHELIRALNRSGRDRVKRHEFVRLQNLLLQYKGEATEIEIKEIKQGNPATSPKGYFWQHLHQHYLPEQVEGNKTHPIWNYCHKPDPDGKQKDEAVVSLRGLCHDLLKKQKDDIKNDLKQLDNPTTNATDLDQIAARWQVSLQKDNVNEKGIPIEGKAAATRNASFYPVLPAGFVQIALGKTAEQHRIGNNRAHSNTPRGKNLAAQIRQHLTAQHLMPDYYNPALLHPEIAQQIAQKQSLFDCHLSDTDKKAWSDTVKTLNDWHTQDQLCLILAETLAQPANISFENGKSVKEFSAQTPTIDLHGESLKDGEPPRTLHLQLSNTTQATRQWMLWSSQRLSKIACWHHPADATLTTQDIQPLMKHYQSLYLSITHAVLGFEQRYYQSDAGNRLKQTHQKQEKTHIPFNTLLSQTPLDKDSTLRENIIALRNAALHDGGWTTADLRRLIGKPDTPLPDHLPIAHIITIGETVLEQLKNHPF